MKKYIRHLFREGSPMKQHRNVGTVRIVYAQLFAAALLVVSCLAISWLSNRIATAQVYGMTDKLYVVNSFIGAFDWCEKAVYDYRWIESWEDGPARAELVRNNMADMDTYLKEMTRGFTAEAYTMIPGRFKICSRITLTLSIPFLPLWSGETGMKPLLYTTKRKIWSP